MPSRRARRRSPTGSRPRTGARRTSTRRRPRAKDILREAREQAAQMVELAGKRSNEIVEEAKGTAGRSAAPDRARPRGDRARKDAGPRRAAPGGRRLAVAGASKLLGREIDPSTHAELLDQLAPRSRVAERATIARPYAKAAFEYARAANAFAAWSTGLGLAAADRRRSARRRADQEPALHGGRALRLHRRRRRPARRAHAELRRRAGRESPPAAAAGNRGAVRGAARRRSRTPSTSKSCRRWRWMRRRAAKLAEALARRFKRQVRMQNSVDATLLGGAMVRAGDLVIDGSLRGRLERLATDLNRLRRARDGFPQEVLICPLRLRKSAT